MGLLDEYWKEREGRETVVDGNGFATYVMLPEGDCYIIDIYVRPERRKAGLAKGYADKVTELARAAGMKRLLGSVDPRANGATESLKVLLAYGMRLRSVRNDLIFFTKDL